MGNILRDNKTILNKTVNIFSNAMRHRMSCVQVSFNVDNGITSLSKLQDYIGGINRYFYMEKGFS